MTPRYRLEEVLELVAGGDAELIAVLREIELCEHRELAPAEAEELRVAAGLVRDLGVNAAGVEVALRMRRRLLALEERMETVLRRLLDEAGRE